MTRQFYTSLIHVYECPFMLFIHHHCCQLISAAALQLRATVSRMKTQSEGQTKYHATPAVNSPMGADRPLASYTGIRTDPHTAKCSGQSIPSDGKPPCAYHQSFFCSWNLSKFLENTSNRRKAQCRHRLISVQLPCCVSPQVLQKIIHSQIS